MIELSIIIPTKNEEENLRFLLEDIKNQEWHIKNRKLTYEIIVADANSTDNTRKIAKEYGAKVVNGGLPGVGRNRGALNAKGKIFFMLDADNRIVNPNLFREAYIDFNKRRLDCGFIKNKPNVKILNCKLKKNVILIAWFLFHLFIRITEKTKNPRVSGASMIFKKESFFLVNGFNENIYYGEDIAIVKQMRNKNLKFGVLNDKLFINVNIRKMLKQGILKFIWNGIILDIYRMIKGEITSKKLYNKIARIDDYFEH